jgi:hypothetical protein
VKQYGLSHGKDGYRLHVWRQPAWTFTASDCVSWLCALSGGVLGGHPRWARLDEWMATNSFGAKRWDDISPEDEGYPANSISYVLFSLENRAQNWIHRFNKDDIYVEISPEQALKIDEKFVRDCDELFSEDSV